jgi:hypothetical protein
MRVTARSTRAGCRIEEPLAGLRINAGRTGSRGAAPLASKVKAGKRDLPCYWYGEAASLRLARELALFIARRAENAVAFSSQAAVPLRLH